MTTKATLYIDPKVYKLFKLRSVETGESISALVNDAMTAQLAEDLEDIETIRTRLDRNENPLSYEDSLKELKRSGTL